MPPKSFDELRQAARNDPERARRIDAAKQRAINDDHRPILWVHYDYGPDGEFSDRRASRADLLAALGDDLYWYCRRVNDWGIVGDCTSEKRRKDHPGCHWAVKP